MFKKALIALAFVIGAQCASAALPAFNQKFEKNGQPIAEKPLVARDFIEFRTARGFPLDGYKDLAGSTPKTCHIIDKRLHLRCSSAVTHDRHTKRHTSDTANDTLHE